MIIKRLISGFIGVFVVTSSVFALDDVPPLRVYMFSPEVMEEVSNEFFADKVIKTEDGKSEVNEVYLYLLNRAADEPTSLQDGECHGCVSGTDIVKACIAGGLTRVNSSKTNDFQRCVDFYLALCEKQEIEAQWDFAQCPPAFDENKKRQNMLTSLTEETRIGDVCGNTPDTNISYGFVTLRKGGYSGQDRYVCTCTAFRCKPGHWMNKKTYQCQEKDPNGNFTEFQLSGTYSYQQFAPKQVEQSLDLDIKPLKSFNYSESIRIKDENLVKQDNTRVVNQTVEMTKAQISAMEPYEQQKKDINSKIMEIGKAKSEILEIYVSANQEALRKCASDYPSVINKEGGVKIENNVFAGALAVPLDMTKDIEEAVKGNFYIVCNPNSTTVNLYMNFIQRINDLYADKLKDLQEAKDMLDIQINAVWNTGKSPCYNNDANCIRVFKDTETMQPDKACYLAERYAAIQMKKIVRCVDMNGACSAYKGKGNQDFVQCTAADGTKYEFEFDDAFGVNGVEGGDDHRAVFGIVYKGQVESYGWKKAGNQYTGSYEVFELKIKNKGNTYEDDCFNMIHDYEMVAAFDDQRFGLNNTEPGKCEFVKAYKDTNAYGINPTVFCSGATQFDFHSNSELSSWLEKYVADKAGVNINKVDCKSEIRWNDYCGGNNVRDKMKGREGWGRCGTPPACDDVKVCYVTDGGNKQKVSFVFDDLNQIFKAETYDKGARESFQCIVSGGTFDGYGCHFANESQCNDFAKGLKSICPDCKAPKWNPSIERCELQDAADMTWWSHGVRYMQIAGGFVFATAITIITGGGGSVTYALVLVEAGGAAIEIEKQMEIWEQPNEFIKKSKACHEVKCAKEYIDNYLNYFGNYSDWEYQGQVDIVDAEMARLLEIIEKDEASMTEFSKNYAKEVGWFKEGGIQGKETHLWNPNDWNADQAWRALGITMQFATMGTGVLTRLLGKSGKLAGKLSKCKAVLTRMVQTAENKIQQGLQTVVDVLDDMDRALGRGEYQIVEVVGADGTKVRIPYNQATPEQLRQAGWVENRMVTWEGSTALRQKASKNFETYLAEIKNSGKSAKLPKQRLSDAEWEELNKSLMSSDNVRLVDTGDGYMRFELIDNVVGLVKAGKWADATVLDPKFDIKVTPLELGGKKYYLKAGDTETLIQNEISRTKQAHELLKHNKIVTSVGVVEDDQTVLKAFMDAHPDIKLPRTPDTQYFIMEATHVDTVEGLSDAKILGYLRNKPITIEEQNTILSELQNMNNNGLIHNDIWHNFAIYRDSGGKLHMELMDFGDFTAEDKLFRSNDDVLEIKKLFSKWSDRGLVEKK